MTKTEFETKLTSVNSKIGNINVVGVIKLPHNTDFNSEELYNKTVSIDIQSGHGVDEHTPLGYKSEGNSLHYTVQTIINKAEYYGTCIQIAYIQNWQFKPYIRYGAWKNTAGVEWSAWRSISTTEVTPTPAPTE